VVSVGKVDDRTGDVVIDSPSVGEVRVRLLAPGNAAFVRRLGELGIPAEADAYGPGIHNWPYWQRELHRALPGIMRVLLT
jgi:diacylglycerol O-acyltransferase/trehalose O-mycolyltransferase